MCFLYRQSISIVYESKFKYIYRYFIKIDRCFCEILQSLPLRKCGLKYCRTGRIRCVIRHFPCGSVDWNIVIMEEIYDSSSHFPCGSVDWNLCRIGLFLSHNQSLPLRKCGLKSLNTAIARMSFSHFPCGSVDWNKIKTCITSSYNCHFPCGSVDWNHHLLV